MAQTESRPQGIFWGQVMRRYKEVSLGILLLVTSQCIAGPAKSSFVHNAGNTTRASAIEFVDKYYAHLKRGISLKKLDLYWSDIKFDDFNKVAYTITKVSGNRIHIERQRMLDIEQSNSLCDTVELIDAKTTWKIKRKAILTYSFTNQCKKWMKPRKRVISLDYLKKEDEWVIRTIITSEPEYEKV